MALCIQVQVKNVYGNATIYPVGEAAKVFASVAGAKTLQPRHIASALALGLQVQQWFANGDCLTVETPSDLVMDC